MPDFRSLLGDARSVAGSVPILAAVPFVTALLAIDNVRRAATTGGYDFHLGVAFRFPTAVVDLWAFVSLPAAGAGVRVAEPVWLIPVFVLVQSALAAGYLGSIDQWIEERRFDFLRNVERHVRGILGYNVLVWAVTLAVLGFGLLAGPLLLVLVPAFLLFNYLFFAAPYLIVVRGDGVGEALGRSYEWAVAGDEYFAFAVQFLVAVALVSVPTTLVAANFGIVGVAVAALCTAPVGLTFSAATTLFVRAKTG